MNSNRVDEKILGGEKTRNFLLGEKWPFLGNISKEWEEKGRVLVCENIYIYIYEDGSASSSLCLDG